MLNVERLDKKSDPRFEEIRRDWRIWASNNGYAKTESILIEQDTVEVSIEILESATQDDRYLLYIPRIPRTSSSETLYIITNQEQLVFTVDAVKKMVKVSLLMIQEKLSVQRYGLN